MAKQVVLGGMTFRNVSFAVIESSGAFADAELGIIGMPIIIAMGGIDWSNDGTRTSEEPFPLRRVASPISSSTILDWCSERICAARTSCCLDTGANTTSLNANFAEAFADLVRQGTKRTEPLTGIGGTRTFESIQLSELLFTISSKPVTLRPAVITMQRIRAVGGECCIGNAGHDLLMQGQGFTIDLSTMTLQLR